MKHGSPYTSTAQVCVEWFNQTLIKKLRKIIEFGKYNWTKEKYRGCGTIKQLILKAIKSMSFELSERNLRQL